MIVQAMMMDCHRVRRRWWLARPKHHVEFKGAHRRGFVIPVTDLLVSELRLLACPS